MSGWTDVASWERERRGPECRVCRSKPSASAQLESSWVLIGPDDPLRGYACLVFSRHIIELHELTDAEGAALMRDIRRLSGAIARIMNPVKMNYEVHGNTAPHLHVHFFPRYRGDQFEGRPIDPTAVKGSAYGPGEFEEFRERLKRELASRAA
jgi:diadenosine tetraphosphate (Ap4A) HIT family hydrolase